MLKSVNTEFVLETKTPMAQEVPAQIAVLIGDTEITVPEMAAVAQVGDMAQEMVADQVGDTVPAMVVPVGTQVLLLHLLIIHQLPSLLQIISSAIRTVTDSKLATSITFE